MWCLEVMLKMNTPEAVQKSQALARRLNRISKNGSKKEKKLIKKD